jgi:hypothetical protein
MRLTKRILTFGGVPLLFLKFVLAEPYGASRRRDILKINFEALVDVEFAGWQAPDDWKELSKSTKNEKTKERIKSFFKE